ncbi:MAG: D-tyrosyl-tRNA(Tyr) deacylase [Cryomorphaceae bacterium]|nr:D-tyrosyl-tRNA(Tyr) deacylase [Cryomorphaceae bacterium]
MRVVVQRVLSASVTIDKKVVGSIGQGLMLLVGIEEADSRDDADWLVNKISQLRIFSDLEGKMNLDLKSIDGKVLIVSQFTLHASYKKGNRPSFLRAAHPEKSIPLYDYFISTFKDTIGDDKVETGEFGAMMDVALVNHGPVTILMDSLNRE